jgi:hypothetical protein
MPFCVFWVVVLRTRGFGCDCVWAWECMGIDAGLRVGAWSDRLGVKRDWKDGIRSLREMGTGIRSGMLAC